MVALLRNQDSDVTIQGDTVTLNRLPAINTVLADVSNAASGLLGRDVTLPTVTSGEYPRRHAQS